MTTEAHEKVWLGIASFEEKLEQYKKTKWLSSFALILNNLESEC